MIKDVTIGLLVLIIVIEIAWIFRDSLGITMESFENSNGPMSLQGDSPDFTLEYPATDKTEMTPDEDEVWMTSLTAADQRARRGQNCLPTYQQAGPFGTTVFTTTKSCEDGMAHTRPGDRIYIPDNINTVMRSDTIRHELVHVYQRRNPEAWKTFYRRSWSYEVFVDPPADLPKELIDGRRANPDTTNDMGGPWACWLRRYWTIPIYKDNYNPRLRDTKVIFWDSWKKEALETPPSDWTAFFGTPGQPEHPNEIAACLLVAEDTSSEAGRRLMTWWASQGLALAG
jgi:hypothetical protein